MLQTNSKRVLDKARMSGKGEPVRIVQEIKHRPYFQMVYAQTRTPLRE